MPMLYIADEQPHGSLLLLVKPCNLRLPPLVISDVLGNGPGALQWLLVAVRTLPEAALVVLLPLVKRHQPLATPLPVNVNF